MRRIRRPEPVCCLGSDSHIFGRLTEKLSKFPRCVRLHATLQGFRPACGMIGERFLGELSQFVL